MNMEDEAGGGRARAAWEREVAQLLALHLDLPMPGVYSLLAQYAALLDRHWAHGSFPANAAEAIGAAPPAIRPHQRAALHAPGGQLQPAQALEILQLRPTPQPLAARLIAAADIGPDDSVLEPSAGSGALVSEIRRNNSIAAITAVEVEHFLSSALRARHPDVSLVEGDFLSLRPEGLGPFSRVVMHPPCGGGHDVAHVLQALRFLAPGGRLVALCEDGQRQRAVLRAIALGSGGSWEPLGPGEVLHAGPSLRYAFVVMEG